MTETLEFRVLEKHAAKVFSSAEGKRLSGLVRKIQLNKSDPRIKQICALNIELLARNEFFFAGWRIHRHYSARELATAELFLLHHLPTFEPAGEECGTRYDEESGCPLCQSGAKQVSPLYLNVKTIPKGKDICRTIAGEVVVSKRFSDLLREYQVTGVRLAPVLCNPKSSAQSNDWFQLIPDGPRVQVVSPTVVGVNPCDHDEKGEYRCPLEDLLGLALLSEVWVKRSTYSGADLAFSEQFIGARRGLLRPENLIFASPKLHQLMGRCAAKWPKIDVTYFS